MSDSSKVIYGCNDCDYKSEYKQNLVRHKKSHEKKDKIPEKLSEKSRELIKIVSENKQKKEKIKSEPKEDIKNDIEIPESINIDDYIESRVEEMLKSQNIPVKVPKHMLTQALSSSGASFIAGAIVSFFLSQNLPKIMAMMSKNSLRGSVPIPTPNPKPIQTLPTTENVKESV
jgi:hypothetical protein